MLGEKKIKALPAQGASAYMTVIRALLLTYVITGILLLILAFGVYKWNMKQSTVETAILIVYIVAAFAGGFVAGKLGRNRKFLWGMVTGAMYVIVLIVVSCIVTGGISGSILKCLTTFVMCAGAGMLGGMVS